ncbi:MAG: sugar transferase [Chitinispirillaceae bacterium]|nr:sugar transferase [Chitinispirillaceae bacterium]
MYTHIIKRKLLMDLFQILDLFIVASVFIFTMAIMIKPFSFHSLYSVIDMRISFQNALFLTVYCVICHIIFRSNGLYESHRFSSFLREAFTLLKVTLFCTATLFAATMIYEMRLFDTAFINTYWISLFVFFVLNRLVLRMLLSFMRTKGRNLRNVLIVGKNARSEKYARKIMAGKKLGYKFKGFVDVSSTHRKHDENDSFVCDFDGFKEYVRKNVVDEIFLFLPIKSFYDELTHIISVCEEQGIMVRMCTDLFQLKFAQAKVEQVDSDMLITLITGNMNRPSILIKEVIDFVLAVILILLTAPIMIVTAILIKMFSPGPVFFRQERIGLHKRKFRIIKFRTMYIDAEARLEKLLHLNEMGNSGAFKLKDDPRVTPIGKILRKLSIDELPQFFNVLMGDMSLIGPRPLTIRDFNGFSIDNHRRRFSVKPGLTCLWQVSGRNNLSFDEWMKLDMQYIDTWSLMLDFKILVQTAGAVVSAKGAQ